VRWTSVTVSPVCQCETADSTDQIAWELNLSGQTVRNHIGNLMNALEVHSRPAAVAVVRHDHPIAH
jgi:DNA-binding NarL/FixJ family response regulator